LDRDEKELEDITKLTNRCAGRAKLIVLSKRELENYLVVPRALIDFIEVKHRLSGQNFSADTNPSEEKMGRALDEAAESLKQWTIEKRVVSIVGKPIYPAPRSLFEGDLPPGPTKIVDSLTAAINFLQHAKEIVQSVFEEQRKEVEARWTNNKLDLVPGDLLLDSVCRVFGTRFNKEVDGERLAALLHDSEISPEIRTFIEGIPQ
jgi:putative ATP-dependent endonuclease of the OLD family